MLRQFLTAAVVAAGLASSVAESAPPQRSPASLRRTPDLPRLVEWLGAAARHEPGEADGAATLVSSWSRVLLEGALLDFDALVQVLLQPDAPRLPRVTRFAPADVKELRRLADLERARVNPAGATAADAGGTINRLVKRGALLHTDIALLLRSTADTAVSATPRLLPVREQVMVSDGRQAGTQYGGVHWDVVRWLLDEITPDPSKDASVRQWYRGVASFMASRRLIPESGPHLTRARQLFPSDTRVLLASGILFETQAAPRVQNFARAARANGGVIDVPSERANMRRAEAYFRRALDLDASLVEARLRLGRVVGLLGRHQEAANELRQSARDADARATQYYAFLFLGAEEEALGHFELAREAFNRAAGIWPTAQSPHLALSQLARRSGDRSGAIRAIQQVFALSSVEEDRVDPWWNYSEGLAATANTLMTEVRAELFLAGR